MAVAHVAPLAHRHEDPIPIRTIGTADLNGALRDGWHDFLRFRGDVMLVSLIYPLIGIAAAVVTLGGNLLPFFFPLAAGISLLGPVVAIGFYELARRREAGLETDWSNFFDVQRRPAAKEIGAVAGLLLAIFALWVFVAGSLFLALWGPGSPPSIGAFAKWLFTTGEGWTLIVAGNAIGAAFALLVLAISVVSLPMLVDCRVNARTAVSASVRAFRANPAAMIRWGLTIALLLVLGSLPLFVGLAAVLPWLGYATWHLYTRLIDRDALAGRRE